MKVSSCVKASAAVVELVQGILLQHAIRCGEDIVADEQKGVSSFRLSMPATEVLPQRPANSLARG